MEDGKRNLRLSAVKAMDESRSLEMKERVGEEEIRVGLKEESKKRFLFFMRSTFRLAFQSILSYPFHMLFIYFFVMK